MKMVVVAIAALTVSACATVPPMTMSAPFDEADVAWTKTPGKNIIKGNAVLRTVGGDVKTCAGFETFAAPASRYTAERMTKIFGSAEVGYRAITNGVNFSDTDPNWQSYNKKVICDSQGNFVFDNLAAGNWYVVTQVTWGSPSQWGVMPQGGMLMQRVAVAGDETKSVVLTQQ